jgi:hypothetical protein
MSSAEKAVLFSENPYRYPNRVDIAQYRQLEKSENNFQIGGGPGHRFTEHRNDVGSKISPRDALVRYSQTHAGRWQADQCARYPGLHANLDPSYVAIDDLEELELFKQQMLHLIAHPSHPSDVYPGYISEYHKYGHPGFDFHAVAHMAQVAMSYNNLLLREPAISTIKPDAFGLQTSRHSGALHDAGETEFPGIKLFHGGTIGDIAADVGKTAEDRRLEKAILTHVITHTFDDVYSPEFNEAVIALAAHDKSKFDKTLTDYHNLTELNHELNSIATAKYLGRKGLEIAQTMPMHANMMTFLAVDSLKRLTKKRDHLQDEGLNADLTAVLTRELQSLYYFATNRDDDPAYAAWRQREPLIERLGAFTPNDPVLARNIAA